MLDAFTASPTVGALRCQPMTTDEIDAHPDADRIWATIVAIRADAESVAEESFDAHERAVEDERGDAAAYARDECANDLRDLIDSMPESAARDDLKRAAKKLADGWK